jgi:FkbM family methyltransferase
MRLAKELRKMADRLDAPGFRESRRLRIPYPLYRLFGRVKAWGEIHSVLDVGANCGQFARAAAQCFPGVAIHAFEPLHCCQTSLCKLRDQFSQVQIHRIALGDETGTVEMFENDYPDSSSLLRMTERHKEYWPRTRNETIIHVPIQTLDGLKSEIGGGPHFLKMDVQGYELHVLRGAEDTLRNTHVVMCEVLFEPFYDEQADFSEIHDFLRDRDFRFAEFVGECRMPPRGELAFADAVFVKSPL